MKNFQRVLLVSLMLLMTGCATVTPVTWKERVEKKSNDLQVQLSYKEQGSKQDKVLLLLHGFGESHFTWRYIADDLAKHHRVISLDLKGFGDSPKPKDGRYSIYDQALAVKQFIQQQQLQNVTLVGHSLGGGVALALTLMAEKEPWQVDGLVLIDAAAYKQNLPSMLRELNQPIIGDIGIHLVSPYYQARKAYEFSFYDDKKIPREGIEESARNFSKEGSRYVYLQSTKQLIPEDIENVARHYSSIKQPTLIIWGYNDVVIKRRYAKRLHKDIKNSQLELIKETGHMPQEEKPEKVLSLIQNWLKVPVVTKL